jgi:hypothetical protein
MGRTLFWGTGEFLGASHRPSARLKMKKPDVSLRADEPLGAGLRRVADDLIDPGNRHDCKFASGFGISKKLKA